MKLLVKKKSSNTKLLRAAWLWACFFFMIKGFSQPENLVLNGGFEEYTVCVPYDQEDHGDFLAYCHNWFNPTLQSPDFFHTCSVNNPQFPWLYTYWVPKNWVGFQHPHSGLGYGGGGVALFLKPLNGIYNKEKEYLSYELHLQLDSNKTYCFSLYANLADIFYWQIPGYPQANSAIKQIHVVFQKNRPFFPTMFEIPVSPTITLENPDGSFLADTMNWMFLRKPFTAQGGERFFTIGNLTATNELEFLYLGTYDTIRLGGTYVSYGTSYYYYDDVALVEIEDVQIQTSTQDLIITRPYSLQANGWAEEYHWYTLENANEVIATGNPAQVVLQEATGGFVLHARNCEVDFFDTLYVNSLPPPPFPPLIIDNLSLTQNVHQKSYFINYTGKDLAPLEVELYTAAGQLIRRFTISASTEIPISDFSAGMYVCRINKGKIPVLIEKLVVTR